MNQPSERGSELTADRQRRLKRAHDVHGLHAVLAACRVAEGTFWRACAGGKIYRGTELAIDQGLEKLESEAP